MRVVDDVARMRALHLLPRRSWLAESLREGAVVVPCYHVVEDEDAEILLGILADLDEPVGFDFETRGWSPARVLPGLRGKSKEVGGLSPSHPAWRAIPVTFQVSAGRESYVVDARHLWRFAGWLCGQAKIDLANAQFEMSVCRNVGVPFHRIHRDCLQMHYLLDEVEHQRFPGLKALARRYLGIELHDFDAIFDEEKGETYESVLATDPVRAVGYAALDPFATTLLADVFDALLGQAGDDLRSFYYRWEQPYQASLARMEQAGLPLDQPAMDRHAAEIQARIDGIDATAYVAAGRPIDLASSKDLLCYYYREQGRPVVVTNPGFRCILCNKQVTSRTGNRCKIHGVGALVNTPKVDDDVLTVFAKAGDLVAPLVQERRMLVKDLGTWVEGFHCHAAGLGIGYPSLKGAFVVSGRLSGGIFLTIPAHLRDVVALPDDSDDVLMAVDFAQLELRVLAHVTEDDVMRRAFHEGRDMHAWTGTLLLAFRARGLQGLKDGAFLDSTYRAIVVAHEKAEEPGVVLGAVEKALVAARKTGKRINFGVVYGMGAGKLAQDLGVSRDEAQEILDVVFSAYASTKAWFDAMIQEVTRTGILRTLLGRMRHISELQNPDPGRRGYGERLVKNQTCQAGAGDVIRGAMIQIDVDMEAGGAYGRVGRGAYGSWTTPGLGGAWRPDADRLPAAWMPGLPAALAEDLGALGRWGYRMILQIHDEILLRGPKVHAGAALERVRRIMADPFGAALQMRVPLEVSGKYGHSYAELK